MISSHTFRVIMIQWCLDSKHPETVIENHSGHKDMRIMNSYNNLRGTEGIQQQQELFVSTGAVNSGGSSRELCKRPKLDVRLKEGSKGQMTATASTGPEKMQEIVAGLRELNSDNLTITINMDNVTNNISRHRDRLKREAGWITVILLLLGYSSEFQF